MRHRTAAVNRVIVLIVGLALLGFGVYAVAWDLQVPIVREWVSRYDRARVTALPDQDWWGWALAGSSNGPIPSSPPSAANASRYSRCRG